MVPARKPPGGPPITETPEMGAYGFRDSRVMLGDMVEGALPSGASLGRLPDPVVGQVLNGTYRIVKTLGKGGMGTVYLCDHLGWGEQCAVKLLTLPDDLTPERKAEGLARFIAEGKLLRELRHKHIVKVHDIHPYGDRYFITMEFLDGQSLQDRLHAGPLSLGEALTLVHDAATALDLVHTQYAVYHRDIKPGNLYLAIDPTTRHLILKILDFGIAHFVHSPNRVTSTGEVIGTPYYMPPEQILARAVDARTDIFALGVVLYELLSGHHPIERETFTAVMMGTCNEEPTDIRTYVAVPDEVAAIITRAIAKQPEDRFQSSAELAGTIATCLAKLPAVAKAAPTAPTLGPTSGLTNQPTMVSQRRLTTADTVRPGQRNVSTGSRRRIALGVGGAALAVGGGLLAYFLAFRNPTTPSVAKVDPTDLTTTTTRPQVPELKPDGKKPETTPVSTKTESNVNASSAEKSTATTKHHHSTKTTRGKDPSSKEPPATTTTTTTIDGLKD